MRSFLLGFLLPILNTTSLFVLDTSTPDITNNKDLSEISTLQSFSPIHPLLPFTQWKHLKRCDEVFNMAEELNKALSCANDKVFSQEPYNEILTDFEIPTCYVITTSSPDVHQTPVFNYIAENIFFGGKILGFYTEHDKTMYLVDNFDIKEIYRHEMQHYFLHIKDGSGNGSHDHKMWQVCEPGLYSPSSEAIENARTKKREMFPRLIKDFFIDLNNKIISSYKDPENK